MPKLNYKEDTKIDESALDVEWLRQSELTFKYCRHEAEAKRTLDKAETNLDIVKAEVDKEIRKSPETYDLHKVTETAISNAVAIHPRVLDAEERVADAQFDVNIAIAAVRSIYAKKDALENLVRLYGQQYFAGPSAPRNLQKEIEKRSEQRANANIKLKRKK